MTNKIKSSDQRGEKGEVEKEDRGGKEEEEQQQNNGQHQNTREPEGPDPNPTRGPGER